MRVSSPVHPALFSLRGSSMCVCGGGGGGGGGGGVRWCSVAACGALAFQRETASSTKTFEAPPRLTPRRCTATTTHNHATSQPVFVVRCATGQTAGEIYLYGILLQVTLVAGAEILVACPKLNAWFNNLSAHKAVKKVDACLARVPRALWWPELEAVVTVLAPSWVCPAAAWSQRHGATRGDGGSGVAMAWLGPIAHGAVANSPTCACPCACWHQVLAGESAIGKLGQYFMNDADHAAFNA